MSGSFNPLSQPTLIGCSFLVTGVALMIAFSRSSQRPSEDDAMKQYSLWTLPLTVAIILFAFFLFFAFE